MGHSTLPDKLEQAQIAIGYTVAAGVGSVPIWVENLTVYVGLFAACIAVSVGLTTLWLNIRRIRNNKK